MSKNVQFFIGTAVAFAGILLAIYFFYPPATRGSIMLVTVIVSAVALAGGFVVGRKARPRRKEK